MNLKKKFLDFKQRIYIILQEKKVIIIVHSFGTLNTLNNLIYKENKDLIPKIKKFIAIGPPFAGATKLLDAFLHGLKDFDGMLTSFHKFGQFLMLKSIPTLLN